MTDDDLKLAAFFAVSEPPARDPAFSTDVMLAVARARFQRDVRRLAGMCVLGATVLGVVWPSLEPAVAAMGRGFAPAGAALAVVALAALMVRRRGQWLSGAGA